MLTSSDVVDSCFTMYSSPRRLVTPTRLSRSKPSSSLHRSPQIRKVVEYPLQRFGANPEGRSGTQVVVSAASKARSVLKNPSSEVKLCMRVRVGVRVTVGARVMVGVMQM